MSVSLEQPDAPPQPHSRPPRRLAIGITAVGVLALLVLGQFLWTWHSRSPFPPEAVDTNVTMSVLPYKQAQAKVDELAGPGRLNVPIGGRQLLVGQLNVAAPPNASPDDQFAVFMIDNRLQKPVDGFWGVTPQRGQVTSGWDYRYNKVAEKYPWLASLAQVPIDGAGWTDPGSAISFPADTAGPITFVAQLDAHTLPVADPTSDVTVALVLVGSNGSIWAQNITD